MDNNKKDPSSLVNGWLDEILQRHDVESILQEPTPSHIGPDEDALASAGLTSPDEQELERIVQETLAENWFHEPEDTGAGNSQDADATQFFAPQAEEEYPVEDTGVEVFNEPQEQDAYPEEADSSPPQKKKGYGLLGIPHILSTVIWLILIVAIGVSLGRTLWLCAADLLALGKEGQQVTVTIDVSDRVSDISEKLEKAGLIRYPQLFELFAKLTGKGDNILVGSVTFNADTVYDYNALINALSYRSSALQTVDVMIPEGYSCAQIFELLEENGVCTAAELEEYAANGELDDYWFLEDVTRGNRYCLEGFLFPDTYEFYIDDEPERVIEKFLDNFDYRFTDRMRDKMDALNAKTGLNLSLYKIVIMASIVEKEKANILEGYDISSVFYNRLTHASAYPFLNSDATILYATDYYNAGQLVTDAQINASPYNTYTQKGLPPTPIANPGLSSLDAALDPSDTGYYYFILDKSANAHVFSKTLAEHEKHRRELGYTS